MGVDAVIVQEEVDDQQESFEEHGMPKAHEVLVRDCVDIYEQFYTHFLAQKVFSSGFDHVATLAKLTRKSHDTMEERTSHLEVLLKDRLQHQDEANLNETEEEALVDNLRQVNVDLRKGVHKFTEAIALACQILVELSSMPTMDTSSSIRNKSQLSGHSSEAGVYKSPAELPKWLQYLLISSCLLDGFKHPEIQLESINTLLEIIELLDSTLRIRPR